MRKLDLAFDQQGHLLSSGDSGAQPFGVHVYDISEIETLGQESESQAEQLQKLDESLTELQRFIDELPDTEQDRKTLEQLKTLIADLRTRLNELMGVAESTPEEVLEIKEKEQALFERLLKKAFVAIDDLHSDAAAWYLAIHC